jgi:capsule biosynthesis phosphatase
MKYIIYCNNPLKYILGRYKIEHIIESIPSNDIYIAYDNSNNNLQEIVIKLFKNKHFYFSFVSDSSGSIDIAFKCIENFKINDSEIIFIFNTKYRDININSIGINAEGSICYFDMNYFFAIYKNNQNIYNFSDLENIIQIDDSIYENKKLRICFDLDNTLITYPTIKNDYSTVLPIIQNINLLKKLKNNGHEIIIYTARGMNKHNNNIGKILKDSAQITIDTLSKFDIEYDELIFGKPNADIYIDDKSLNPYINNISYFGL